MTETGQTLAGPTVLLVLFVFYGLMAERLERWLISSAMFFVVAGVLLGSSGADLLPLHLRSETMLVVTELTLGLLLFADAATVRLRDLERDEKLPTRLLTVGLLLTIALGTVVARALFPRLVGRLQH